MSRPKKRGTRLTPEQIKFAEENFYYLQIGHETVEYSGRQTFSKEKAEYLFWELRESMTHMRKHGNAEDKRTAHLGLINFRIHPLRFH